MLVQPLFVTVKTLVADVAETFTLPKPHVGGVIVRLHVRASPQPVSVAVAQLVLSPTVRLADSARGGELGENVTVTQQVPAGLRECVVQVSAVTVKSVALVPENIVDRFFVFVIPVLVTMNV